MGAYLSKQEEFIDKRQDERYQSWFTDYEKYKEYVLPVKKVQSADGHRWRVILKEHLRDKAFEGKKVNSTVEDG